MRPPRRPQSAVHQHRPAIIALLTASLLLGGRVAIGQDDRQGAETERRLVALVDAAEAGDPAPAALDLTLGHHLLQAADGSGYVPFSVGVETWPDAVDTVGLYVRVVSRPDATMPGLEGLIEDRVADLPADAPRGSLPILIMLPEPGEMPVGGPALTIGSAADRLREERFATLALLQLGIDQANAEERAARRAAERRARYPYEAYFETHRRDPVPWVRRAIYLQPGRYDIFVAALASVGGPAPAAVVQRPLVVPPFRAGGELALSQLIVADAVELLDAPRPPSEQMSHPYTFGWTEMTPAVDTTFDGSAELAVAFQVLNPVPDDRNKPDVVVEYDFYQVDDGAETYFRSTDLQGFNAEVLPSGFDLGTHQIFALQRVPLATFPSGHYRLEISATDYRALKTVTKEVRFTVEGGRVADTDRATTLPRRGYVGAFERREVLAPEATGFFLDRLVERHAAPLPSDVAGAIADVRAGQYGRVLETVASVPGESTATAFLRGLAWLEAGDLNAASTEFRAAIRQASDFLPAVFYLGACYAAGGRDRQALGAWRTSLITEVTPVVYSVMADAHLRLAESEEAIDLLDEALALWPDEPGFRRQLAMAYLLGDRATEALSALQDHLAAQPDDVEAVYLAVRLLQETAEAGGTVTGRVDDDRDLLVRLGRQYLALEGVRSPQVAHWVRLAGGDPN